MEFSLSSPPLLFIIICLLFFTHNSYAQSVEHTGHIEKNGQYYYLNGSSISYTKLIQLLKSQPESNEMVELAFKARKASKTIGLFGLGYMAVRTMVVYASTPNGYKPNHTRTLVVGAATLIGVVAGLGASESNMNRGIALFNSKVGNDSGKISNDVTYHLHFTGNGLGLKMQF